MSSSSSATITQTVTMPTQVVTVSVTEAPVAQTPEELKKAEDRKAAAAERREIIKQKNFEATQAKMALIAQAAAEVAQRSMHRIKALEHKKEKEGELSEAEEAALAALYEKVKKNLARQNRFSLKTLGVDADMHDAETGVHFNEHVAVKEGRVIATNKMLDGLLGRNKVTAKSAITTAALVTDGKFLTQMIAIAAAMGMQDQAQAAIEEGSDAINEFLKYALEINKAIRTSKEVRMASGKLGVEDIKELVKELPKVSDINGLIEHCVLNEGACKDILGKLTSGELDNLVAAYKLLVKKGVPDHDKIVKLLGEEYAVSYDLTENETRAYLGHGVAPGPVREAVRSFVSGRVTNESVTHAFIRSAAEVRAVLRGLPNPKAYATAIAAIATDDPIGREIVADATRDRLEGEDRLRIAAGATAEATTTSNDSAQSTAKGRQVATIGALFTRTNAPCGLFPVTRNVAAAEVIETIVEIEESLEGGYTEALERIDEDALGAIASCKLLSKSRTMYVKKNNDVHKARTAASDKRKAEKAKEKEEAAPAVTKKSKKRVEVEEDEEEEVPVVTKKPKAASKKRAEEEEVVVQEPPTKKAKKQRAVVEEVVVEEEEEEEAPVAKKSKKASDTSRVRR